MVTRAQWVVVCAGVVAASMVLQGCNCCTEGMARSMVSASSGSPAAWGCTATAVATSGAETVTYSGVPSLADGGGLCEYRSTKPLDGTKQWVIEMKDSRLGTSRTVAEARHGSDVTCGQPSFSFDYQGVGPDGGRNDSCPESWVAAQAACAAATGSCPAALHCTFPGQATLKDGGWQDGVATCANAVDGGTGRSWTCQPE